MKQTTMKLKDIKETEPVRDMGNLSSMIESLKEVGIINPITVTEDGKLLAGRRRFAAAKELKWKEIPVRILDPKDELEKVLIEFYENVKRKPLTEPENRRYIALIDKMMREKFGSVKERERTDLTVSDPDTVPKWSQAKTAEKIGIGQSKVSEAVQAVAFVEEHPELRTSKTPVILDEKRKDEIIESLPNGDKALITRKAKRMDAFELKEVVEKAKEIDKIIEEVVRPETRERLERRWAMSKYDSDAKPEILLETIRKEKGLSPDQFKKVWNRQISKLKQTKVGYPSVTEYKEWGDDEWLYAQCTTKIKKVAPRVPLIRVDYPRSKFRDVEEADQFAASYGGYCSTMLSLHGVDYWCLYMKETPKK